MRVSVHSPHLTTPPSGAEACHVHIRLLCKSYNLMKAENRFGREFMARFRDASRGSG
jgi:hypothetical protein